MKAKFYVSNMGWFFLDLENSFSDAIVGCTSNVNSEESVMSSELIWLLLFVYLVY